MDTVLNLGLNDKTVEALAKKSGDRRFAFDSYRRFVQMYSDVVLGIEINHFEKHLERAKEKRGVKQDCELLAEDLEKLVKSYKTVVQLELGEEFPEDPKAQLWGAIGAVFNSWMNQRAKTYRQLHDIPEWWGTAVNVQAMVFGNMGSDCATGVAFTRDPSTGTNEFYGEFLVNAQGEDVVAGIRTPQELTIKARKSHGSDLPSLEEVMPNIFRELLAVRSQLETHYKDMQDIEFTIQQGKLYMLQTRNGKRTAPAALQIAVDMAKEGLITKSQALMSLKPDLIDQLLHPTLDPKAKKEVIAKGLPASPGAAGGKVVFSADEAVRRSKDGDKVILVRIETSPDDIHGLHAAEGVLTTRGIWRNGGMTSHAAVVARGMGRPCVAGAGGITVDYAAAKLTVGSVTVTEGQILTIDGSTGEVMVGEVPTVPPQLSGSFGIIMEWADEVRDMKVRANAETPADARQAKEFGAEGIGLVRTEHMFFDGQRIVAMRQMILATDENDRRQALEKRAAELQEANPMLGHRGCRLAITYPEICEMQARAIFEAAAEVGRSSKKLPVAEVMVPLVATTEELKLLKGVIEKTADAVKKEQGITFTYKVGTMIELPRAALQAGKLAEMAEFFSFGTNDLTQTTYGLSRDDAGSFLPEYKAKGIVEQDPFVSLDPDGVGELITMAVQRGRSTRPDMKMGICGEHGGDPASIEVCERIGLDYVSCSPFRVPVARLAAAQSALKTQGEKAKQSSTKATKPRVQNFGPWNSLQEGYVAVRLCGKMIQHTLCKLFPFPLFSGEAMGRIGLLFELRHAETRPGETVTVVGARGELGAWDCYRSGLQLRTGASCYPYWAMLAPVWVSPGIDGSSASLCRSQVRRVRDASVIPEEPEVVSCGDSGEVEDARNSNFIQVEYKYVKDRRQVKDCGPSIQWEDSIANRMVSLPFEPGSIWIISDSKFNDAREQPKVIRTSLVEILSRRDKLDMEFRESLQDAHSSEWSGREEDDESSHHSWGTNWSHHTTSTIGFLTGF
ncbi:Pyruvate [Durusdinium trenchii]|uniref:pyruvate, phosphate dikinase n=1 Tax=Durusdinium trenchii TaxID=1381693 RepID=A0ABP0Q3M2_9DINO